MALAVTITEIRDRFVEFSNGVLFPDALIQSAIDFGLDCMSDYVLSEPTLTYLAQLMIAHYLVLFHRSSLGNSDSVSPLETVELGPIKEGFQGNNADSQLSSTLESTVYGQMFQMRLLIWQKQNRSYISR